MTHFLSVLRVSAVDSGDVRRWYEAVHTDNYMIQWYHGTLAAYNHGVERVFGWRKDICHRTMVGNACRWLAASKEASQQ